MIDPVPIEVRRERVRRGSRRQRDLMAVALADEQAQRDRLATVGEAPGAGSAWTDACVLLAASVPMSSYKIWLQPLQVVGADGSTLFLSAPEGITAWVGRRYASLIREALQATGSGYTDVEFVSAEGAGASWL